MSQENASLEAGIVRARGMHLGHELLYAVIAAIGLLLLTWLYSQCPSR